MNQSFEFLLEKPDYVPEWTLRDDDYFISFLAGYVDAEGSFYVGGDHDKATAGFRLPTTERRILEECPEKLTMLGVHCTALTIDARAGHTNKFGITSGKHLWVFEIIEKEWLL